MTSVAAVVRRYIIQCSMKPLRTVHEVLATFVMVCISDIRGDMQL